MTTQNWPDPKRPGVPLFPDYPGKHLLRHINGGRIFAFWICDRPNEHKWDVVTLPSEEPENIACDFTYVRCEAIKLTPTQINEMLAAERQWCADACRAMSFDSHYTKTQRDALEEAENAIRNLGAAP